MNNIFKNIINIIAAGANRRAKAKKAAETKAKKAAETIIFGSYHHKPIEWIVLSKEGDKALLLSKYALDCQPYNTTNTGVLWKTCSLRKWLNNEFYNTAFSPREMEMIVSTTLINSESLDYSSPYKIIMKDTITTDKVFLLSLSDVINTDYGFSSSYDDDDEARRCQPTEYAIAQGCWYSDNRYREFCWWWLRSPGCWKNLAADVHSGGSVGSGGHSVDDRSGAVRPALWINLESLVDNTKDDTFYLERRQTS